MRATDGTIRHVRIAAESASWITRLVLVAFTLLAATGLFLLERRIVGALSDPIPLLQLLATAALTAAAAYALCERTDHSNLALSVAAGLILVFAIACSFPGNRILDWLVWFGVSAAAFSAPLLHRLRAVESTNPTSIRVADVTDLDTDGDSEKVLQNLTRIRTAEGHEAIRGMLLAEFRPSERQTTLHVGFCPPFERLPEIEANVVDDSETDVRITQVFHHGAQFELRLPEPASESTTVEIEFFAIEAQSEGRRPAAPCSRCRISGTRV